MSRGLGARGSAALGSGLARLAYRPFGVRRRLVESNLRAAFPDRPEIWIHATAAASYAHFGREAFEMLRLSRLTAADVVARTRVHGLEELKGALAAGVGVVVVTGHFGNWEIGGAAVAARGVPLDVVAQRQANPLVDAALVAARSRLGLRVIDRRHAPKEVLRGLRRGRGAAFVADQDARRHGIFVPFFGRPASTHRGPALLALRSGAPVFLGTAERAADGRYDVTLRRLEVDRQGDAEAVVERLTAAFTAALEAVIRRVPSQYFWHHRRWKTRPREEQRPAGAVYDQGHLPGAATRPVPQNGIESA